MLVKRYTSTATRQNIITVMELITYKRVILVQVQLERKREGEQKEEESEIEKIDRELERE